MTYVGKEYGTALYELAFENGVLDRVYDDLSFLKREFDKSPEYLLILSSPSLPKDERIGNIQKIFSERVHEYVCSFLCLLCQKDRIQFFSECHEAFCQLYEDYKRCTTAFVTSAVPLDETQKQKIKAKLEKQTGNSVTLVCRIDPALIGGVVIDFDGYVIDGTVKRRLKEIKEVMEK